MNQDTFVFDLLQRVVAIQRTISVTDANGAVYAAKFTYPRWWQPIGNDQFPGFFNRARRLSSTPQGRPIRQDVYQVTMRMIIGPAFAGYRGEYEDMGNLLYAAVINAFDAQQRLAIPGAASPANEPLQYVVAARVLNTDNGIEGKDYGGTPQTVYMVIDIPMDVTVNFSVYRQS